MALGSGAPGASDAADTLIVVGAGRGPDVDGTGRAAPDLGEAAAILLPTRARTVVVVSSALVYGAWDDNPVPLTEDAPLRPRPESPRVADLCELERIAAELRATRPGTTVAILRPTICIDPVGSEARWRRLSGASRWMESSVWHARSQVGEGVERPAQYLHIDDLARAVEHARRMRLDGVFNVAPPGWLSAQEQLDLVGSVGAIRVPGRLRRLVHASRWRIGIGSIPPDLVAYSEHPWVISGDKLVATGWRASYTNEEAFVLGHRAGWWSTLNPDQRQAVSLGALAGGLLGAGWVGAALLRRFSRGGRSGQASAST